MNNRAYIDALTAELEAHGVSDYRVEHGGKHPRLIFTFRGREMFKVFPASPSDNRRGIQNAVRELRKLMSVKRKIHKSTGPKRERNRTEPRIKSLSLTVKPGPFEVLRDWKQEG